MPNLTEYNILVYFSCITLIISSLLYIQFYNKTILGGIKDELSQYENNTDNKLYDKVKKERESINKFKDLIVVMLFFILFLILLDVFFNIRIKGMNKGISIFLLFIIFIVISSPIIAVLLIYKYKFDVGDEDETEKDDIFKLNDKEGLHKSGTLIIGFIGCYYLCRLLITKGILGNESRITYYNNFIFYEKIFGLLFIVLLCSSVIIVNNKKKELMNNLNGQQVEKNNENNKNNNTIINVLVGILITFLGIYYFNNHIKNNKFDLIGSFQKNNLFSLFDLPLFLLIGAFVTVGLIKPYTPTFKTLI
jgi:hypothetical protein